MTAQPKFYVASNCDMVGSAIIPILHQLGQTNIVTRTHVWLELTKPAADSAFSEAEKLGQVYLADAKVGAIYANNNYLRTSI